MIGHEASALLAMQQLHAIRRGLADVLRRYEAELPAKVVGELNAVIFEAIHEGNEQVEAEHTTPKSAVQP